MHFGDAGSSGSRATFETEMVRLSLLRVLTLLTSGGDNVVLFAATGAALLLVQPRARPACRPDKSEPFCRTCLPRGVSSSWPDLEGLLVLVGTAADGFVSFDATSATSELGPKLGIAPTMLQGDSMEGAGETELELAEPNCALTLLMPAVSESRRLFSSS